MECEICFEIDFNAIKIILNINYICYRAVPPNHPRADPGGGGGGGARGAIAPRPFPLEHAPFSFEPCPFRYTII